VWPIWKEADVKDADQKYNGTSKQSWGNWAPRHEGVLGSGGIAPCILDLYSGGRWVVSFTPRPLYPQGKSSWYALDRRLGWPQSRSGHGGEEKKFLAPTGTRIPDHPARSPALYHRPIPALQQSVCGGGGGIKKETEKETENNVRVDQQNKYVNTGAFVA
jgi:hypothetical protein